MTKLLKMLKQRTNASISFANLRANELASKASARQIENTNKEMTAKTGSEAKRRDLHVLSEIIHEGNPVQSVS